MVKHLKKLVQNWSQNNNTFLMLTIGTTYANKQAAKNISNQIELTTIITDRINLQFKSLTIGGDHN